MSNSFVTHDKVVQIGAKLLGNYNVAYSALRSGYVTESDIYNGSGGSVRVRVRSQPGAEIFDTSYTAGTTNETAVTVPVVKVNTYQQALTTEDLSLNIVDFAAQIVDPHMQSLADKINDYIYSQAILAQPNFVGDGSAKTAAPAFIEPTKTLSRNKSKGNRRALVGSTAAYELNSLDLLLSANRAGNADTRLNATKENGYIGRLGGCDWWEDQAVDSAEFTAGTYGVADDPTLDDDALAGATTINLTNATAGGTIKAGDMFTISSVPNQTFTFTADATAVGAGPYTVAAAAFTPALPIGVTDGDVVNILKPGESYVKNLMFDSGYAAAIVLPTRQAGGALSSDNTFSFYDPKTGMGVTMQRNRNSANSAELINFEAYVGCKVIQPSMGCLLV